MTTFLINPLSLYEHIKTKQKIFFVDSHHYLPWILFTCKDNNVVIYDVNKKHVIRAFSLSQYLPEDIKIKGIKFFDCIDKNFINNYETNPMFRVKGIPLNLRSSLIYLVSDKYVFFYSYLLQNFIRFIPSKELNDSNIVAADVYDYSYMLILTEDGNINKWSIQNWSLKQVISAKEKFGKALLNLKVIHLEDETKYAIVATKNGKLFSIDFANETSEIQRIDNNSKFQHEKEILYMEFNRQTNILITASKNYLILYDIKNPNKCRKVSNFVISSDKNWGIIPNTTTFFDNSSYFIYGKSSQIFLINLNVDDQSKIDNKNYTKLAIYSLDVNNQIHSCKVNDEETKIFKVIIAQHLCEYLVIATNKGLLINKFDSSYKTPLTFLPMVPNVQNRGDGFFFYYLTKDNLILEKRLSLFIDKKNKMQIKPEDKIIQENVFKDCKNLKRFEIKFSYDFSIMSCLDIISNTFILYKIEFNSTKNITELKIIDKGEALNLQWSPYNNNFAITKRNNATSFSLEVYTIKERSSTKEIYEINNLLAHKIFNGHFIGVIAKKTADLPMKYVNNYSYDISKDAELTFYYWDEENKLTLNIKDEPLDIISSEDLQYMIICFEEKFNIYKLNDLTGCLEKINTVYNKVNSGIIYENLVFIYLTEYGVYFQLLNNDNCYPCKLFRQSDELNMYNLKISKKFKENKIIYPGKPKQTKILCVNDNLMFTCDDFGNIESSEINHILFKLISLIKKKNFAGVTALLGFLDKKLIKFVLLIFDHYFENDEQLLRKIFTIEMIQNFELYNYFEFFIKDLATINPSKLENVLEKYLIKAIMSNDPNKINQIYTMANDYNLKMVTKSARTIDRDVYLDTLMNKKRYVESYLFNSVCQINNKNNENILAMALEQLTAK